MRHSQIFCVHFRKIRIFCQSNDTDDHGGSNWSNGGGGGGSNWRPGGNGGNSWQGKAPKKNPTKRTAPYNNDKSRAPTKCGICRETG